MKTRITSKILKTLMLLLCTVTWITAQQTTIEYNSDSQDNGGTEGPHLLLLETGDTGNGQMSNQDGWARLWFKNASDAGDNRWAFLARPHAGAIDNDKKLNQPIIVAHNGTQKFGVSSNGFIRINKKYILPNDTINTSPGMSLQLFDGTDTLGWGYMDYIKKDATASNATLHLHENSNDGVFLGFSNDQFVNSRFFISADPSNTGPENAMMKFGWGSLTNSALQSDILILDAADDNIGINTLPDEDFTLYTVPKDVGQRVAHFGQFNAGSTGFVTINSPNALPIGTTSILRIKANDNTIADFYDGDGDIRFEAPLEMRDHINVFNANVEIKGSTPGDFITGGDVVASQGQFSGVVTCNGTALCSDARYKENVKPIGNALSKVMALNGVYYDWKTDDYTENGFTDERQIGFIAQDLEKEFPELVITKEDGYKAVSYDKMSAILVEAIKEQQAIIDELRSQNKWMKQEMTEFRAEFKAVSRAALVSNNIVEAK